MPIIQRSLKIFICHSSGDKPIVRELYQKLAVEGWLNDLSDEKILERLLKLNSERVKIEEV